MGPKNVANFKGRAIVAGLALGLVYEVLFMPPGQNIQSANTWGGLSGALNIAYLITSPMVIWWWLRRFLPSRKFSTRELIITNLLLGAYLAGLIRACAIVVFDLMRYLSRVPS